MDEGLTQDQAATWLAYRRMHIRLMTGLDRQLAHDSRMPQGYYAVLAQLAGQPDRRLLLSELARRCNFSQSRLSHAVARMEESGWVVREDAGTARPSTYARLTDTGAGVQATAAIGHDRAVRELVFGGLTTAQADQLRILAEIISEHIAEHQRG
ncbi:DNA-binding MarR family transcriptional regulator [Nakamurella sp. UYEF19]|uniref:MarR family winged helix-turn-helix transcriptional regulator n=1 Tax=Nakamurella sp. UYEF19 TaxID=1756392 RepID=UPI00339494AB